MRKAIVKSVISCFSAGRILSCSGAGTRYGTSESLINNLINTSLEFVDDASQKLWEGEISGKRVTYFRTLDNSNFKDVVVVTMIVFQRLTGARSIVMMMEITVWTR